ncbi:Hypothetical predicted protein, partial [Paramuricea clavata]
NGRGLMALRTQFVQFNDYCSCPNKIQCGVPQGSILGLLLFLNYINDIIHVSSILELILIADDTNLFISNKDPIQLTNILNIEIRKLSDWFKSNKLSLNLEKNKIYWHRVLRQQENKTNYFLCSCSNKKGKIFSNNCLLDIHVLINFTCLMFLSNVVVRAIQFRSLSDHFNFCGFETATKYCIMHYSSTSPRYNSHLGSKAVFHEEHCQNLTVEKTQFICLSVKNWSRIGKYCQMCTSELLPMKCMLQSRKHPKIGGISRLHISSCLNLQFLVIHLVLHMIKLCGHWKKRMRKLKKINSEDDKDKVEKVLFLLDKMACQ